MQPVDLSLHSPAESSYIEIPDADSARLQQPPIPAHLHRSVNCSDRVLPHPGVRFVAGYASTTYFLTGSHLPVSIGAIALFLISSARSYYIDRPFSRPATYFQEGTAGVLAAALIGLVMYFAHNPVSPYADS